MRDQRIIAVHLLNDYSGSPNVFRQAIDVLKDIYAVELYTATPSGSGALSDIMGISQHSIFYKWHSNKVLTLFFFLLSQAHLFFKLLKNVQKKDIIYINTLLPFGAALAGKVKGCKVVYHVHEVSIQPRVLKKFLTAITNGNAHQIIFVSHFVANQFQFNKPATCVVHNALPHSFITDAATVSYPNLHTPFTVAMLCSLKPYKGIYEFVALSRRLPSIHFTLVLNASKAQVDAFEKEVVPPSNCALFPVQKNTLPFYKKAHLVLNLSRTDAWLETFGMTVLEAMHCGRPVIVPNIGGVCELVNEGVEGFRINGKDEQAIFETITKLSSDVKLYLQLSQASRLRAAFFSNTKFADNLTELFNNLTCKSIYSKKLPLLLQEKVA